MSTSAYPVLTEIQQVFKSIIWDPMIKAGEWWLETEIPALDLPVIKQLDEDAIQAISDYFFNQLVLFVDVEAIKLVNPILQNKWATASEALVLISQEQGVNSSAYQKALSEAAADFAAWVHTGSPQ